MGKEISDVGHAHRLKNPALASIRPRFPAAWCVSTALCSFASLRYGGMERFKRRQSSPWPVAGMDEEGNEILSKDRIFTCHHTYRYRIPSS